VREHRQGARGREPLSRFRAVVFDLRGTIDLEFAREMAVDSAIAAACGLEGLRVDQAMVEEASDKAVVAFAHDTVQHMVESLCGGEPATVERVLRRVDAMVANLDVFQLRPEIEGLLQRLRDRGLRLGLIGVPPERAAQMGLARYFDVALEVDPAACIFVGSRVDKHIMPANVIGMTPIQLRSGRYRKQRPRDDEETPVAVVTDVRELEAAIDELLAQ
jgi:FMN phosphatase YigB (HAD superfamily)